MRMSTVLAGTMVLIAAGCGRNDTQVDELRRANEQLGLSIARLQQTQQDLKAELEALRKARAVAAPAQEATPAPAAAPGGDLAKLVKAEVARQLGNGEDIAELVQEQLRKHLAAREEREREEREERDRARRREWEDRRNQWDRQQWDGLAKDLTLTENQVNQLRAASQTVRQSVGEMMGRVRDQGFDAEKMRQAGEELKAKYEAQLSQILSAEQLEAYRKRPNNMLRMMELGIQAGRMFQPGGLEGGPRGERDRRGPGEGMPPPGAPPGEPPPAPPAEAAPAPAAPPAPPAPQPPAAAPAQQ